MLQVHNSSVHSTFSVSVLNLHNVSHTKLILNRSKSLSSRALSCGKSNESAVIKQDGCHFLSLNEIDVKTGVNTHILTFTARYG